MSQKNNTKFITLNIWSVQGKWSDIRKMSGGYTTNDMGQTVPANDGNYISDFEPDFFVSMMFKAIDFNDALQQARDSLSWVINTANEIVSIENMGGANYGSVGDSFSAFPSSLYSKIKQDVIDGIKASKRGVNDSINDSINDGNVIDNVSIVEYCDDIKQKAQSKLDKLGNMKLANSVLPLKNMLDCTVFMLPKYKEVAQRIYNTTKNNNNINDSFKVLRYAIWNGLTTTQKNDVISHSNLKFIGGYYDYNDDNLDALLRKVLPINYLAKMVS
jgi:hypothetical protein